MLHYFMCPTIISVVNIRKLFRELEIMATFTQFLLALRLYNTLMLNLASLEEPSVSISFCTLNRYVCIFSKSCKIRKKNEKNFLVLSG